MIEIRHLVKDYGSFRAVDRISLDVPRGQVLGLLGPNGAGKTTTIRIITGYMPPTAGSVRVDGHDSVTEADAVRRRLGYLPEANPLYTEMRVVEYLRFRARLFGVERSKRSAAIERVIERCWLAEMRRRQIGRLSKGYRQRVGLAAALLHDPPLLVLDEPTSGLDPVQIRETRRLIRELAGDHTMILSSHILPEVERTVDRIVILSRGRIRAEGTPAELVRRADEDEQRHVLEVGAESADAVAAALSRLDAAAEVERHDATEGEGAWTRFDIVARRDLREGIGRLVRETGALCRRLEREQASLESLFVRVTAEEAADGTAAGGAIARDRKAVPA